MQAINDFTRSLTNHHVLRLNIYKAGTLYLANNVFRNTVSVLYMEVCTSHMCGLNFLHWPHCVQKKSNLHESCCDPEIRSPTGLTKKRKKSQASVNLLSSSHSQTKQQPHTHRCGHTDSHPGRHILLEVLKNITGLIYPSPPQGNTDLNHGKELI